MERCRDDPEIDLLGRFAVRHAGRPVAAAAFGGQLARRLVRVLVAHRGEVVTREALIDALWGDRAPADPEANLNVVVNRARRGLGDPAVIETVDGGYLFGTGGDVTVDAEVFAARVRAARRAVEHGRPADALTTVQDALRLWRGTPLPEDTYAQWARPHRDRLERDHQDALEVGARAALACGDARRAAELADAAVTRQPLREIAHVLHIRALAAGGDTAAALAAHDRLRRRLADELGIDPSPEVADLHRRLLHGDPMEEATAATGPPTGPGAFVGRGRQVAQLAALVGGRRIGLLRGRSGSGKSRLLAELAARTTAPALATRAVLPEHDVPWSLARTLLRAAIAAGADPSALPPRSLAALADVLPELERPGARAVIAADSRRALALEAGVRLLAGVAGAVVLADDLQWADASSLDLLAVVAGRRAAAAIVVAYRPEEVPADGEVARFLSDLHGTADPLEVDLAPLTAAALEPLVPDPALAAVLAEATDGTPFAVLEVLGALEQRHAVRRDGAVWRATSDDALDRAAQEARAGQQRAVLVRAGRQPRVARELLGMLALLGRPASTRLLADATGVTPDAQGAHLEALARAALVRHEAHGWSTAHDIIGETLRERLDPTERAGLHQMLARALGHEPDSAAERARHLARAGDRTAAAATYAAAAGARLARCADREAERLAEAGLELDPPETARAELLEIRGQARTRAGRLPEARDDLRAALAATSSSADRSRLLTRLAALASGSEDLLRADHLVDLALAEAGGHPAARARALAAGAIVDMNLDRPERAERRYAEALSLFERAGDARGVADVLDARAMATFLDGDITAAIGTFDRVARLFADAGDLLRVVTPRSTRGHALVFAGSPVDGLADAEEALELARSLGNPDGQAYAQWHRSEALTACSRPAEAVEAATGALDIARRIGHRGWTATALRGLGVAHQAQGDAAAAEDAFARSLAASARLPLFASWAHARLALVLVTRRRFDAADGHVLQALATGPPLGHYEARLARCELAVARGDTGAGALLAAAAAQARRGGEQVTLTRLSALAG